MPSVSFTTPNIMKVGLGAIGGAILALMVKGSVLVNGGNVVVNPALNPNSGIVYGTRPLDIPTYAVDSNSGSLAKYDTIIARCPFNAVTAPSRGLKTGTASTFYTELDIIANPKGVSLDCSVVTGPLTGTAGTLIFDNKSATGSVNVSTTPFTCGPTQYVKCGTLGSPGASFSGSLIFRSTYAEVVN